MLDKIKSVGALVSAFGLFFFVHSAYAVTYRSGLDALGGASGLGLQQNSGVLVGTIIVGVLGLIGIVALVLIIYSGFLWMIAQGDPAKITKAKNIMIYAFIGLAIILASYLITQYLINNVFLGNSATV